jgi:hypothetical protein
MKKLAFLAIALLFLAISSQAQIRYGIRAGLSSTNLDKETIQSNGISVAIKDADYGFHFGLFARGKLTQRLYIQPEAVFNSSTVNFTVNDLQDGLMDKVLSETYRNLDLPLMLGYKLGPLRLEAGPVGHVYVASKSEIEDEVSGYDKKFNNFNMGYQAGVGLDIWKILVDLRYEGNFTKFGDHMRIGGEDVKFSNAPTRWVLTAGFSF